MKSPEKKTKLKVVDEIKSHVEDSSRELKIIKNSQMEILQPRNKMTY